MAYGQRRPQASQGGVAGLVLVFVILTVVVYGICVVTGVASLPNFASWGLSSDSGSNDDSSGSGDLIKAGEPLMGQAYDYGGNHGVDPEVFWQKHEAGTNKRRLDCSSFIRMVVYRATKIDVGERDAAGFIGSSHWKTISKADVRRNDLLVLDTPGRAGGADHIAIAVRKLPGGKVKVFDDSGGAGKVSIRTVGLGMFTHALRWKG